MLKKIIIMIMVVFVFSKEVSAGFFGEKLKLARSGDRKTVAAEKELQNIHQLLQSMICLHNDSSHKLEFWQEDADGVFKFIYLMNVDEKIKANYLGFQIGLRIKGRSREFIIAKTDILFDTDFKCILKFSEWGSWFTNYDIYCNDTLLKKYNHCVGMSGCVLQ